MATLNPYLNFRGTTREVMEFYHSVFGGDLAVSSFADFGAPVDPSEADQVMHSQLTTPGGFTIMAADVPSHMDFREGENQFSISLSGSSDEGDALEGYFTALAAGGTIAEPLVEAPWGDRFGMLVDKFGVSWLVNIAAAAA